MHAPATEEPRASKGAGLFYEKIGSLLKSLHSAAQLERMGVSLGGVPEYILRP